MHDPGWLHACIPRDLVPMTELVLCGEAGAAAEVADRAEATSRGGPPPLCDGIERQIRLALCVIEMV